MVGRHEGRQVLVLQAILRQAHGGVGALVGAADERLALLDAAVGGAVDLDVVVGRVRVAVRQLLRDEPVELVLELVGDRVADHREVRLVGVEDVADQRPVAGLPVQALLDVGLLADDAGLEDREVAGLRGREALGHVVLEAAGEARLAGPVRPARDRARHRGVEQADLREVGGEPLDLDEERAGLAVEGRWRSILTFTSAHSPSRRSATSSSPSLRGGEQHAVIARAAVVAAVVDVGVEAVLVDPGRVAAVQHPHAHLLRGAVGARDIRPVGGRRRRGLLERRPAGEALRVIELEAERSGEGRVVGRRDVVGRHAAAGAEVAEVDGRAVDGAAAAAGPLDLGDLLAAALGRLGQRLGLQHAGVVRRGAIRECVAVLVERVVGRAVDARPRAGGEREPAGAGVRRRLRQQPVVRRPRSVLEQITEARCHALVGVLLDRLLHQAVGGEEEELVLAAIVPMTPARGLRGLGADPWHDARRQHRGSQ